MANKIEKIKFLLIHSSVLIILESFADKYISLYGGESNSFFTLFVRYIIFTLNLCAFLAIFKFLNLVFNILFNIKTIFFKIIFDFIFLLIQSYLLTFLTNLCHDLTLIRLIHFSFTLAKIFIYNYIHMNVLFYKNELIVKEVDYTGCTIMLDYQEQIIETTGTSSFNDFSDLKEKTKISEIYNKKSTFFYELTKVHNFIILFYSIFIYYFHFFPFNLLPIELICLFFYDTKKNFDVIHRVADDFFKDKNQNEINASFLKPSPFEETLTTSDFLSYFGMLKLLIFSVKYSYKIYSKTYNDSLFLKSCSSSSETKFQFCPNDDGYDILRFKVDFNLLMSEFLLEFSKTGISTIAFNHLFYYLLDFFGLLTSKILTFSASAQHNDASNSLFVSRDKDRFFLLCVMNGTWLLNDKLRLVQIKSDIIYAFLQFLCEFSTYLDVRLMSLAMTSQNKWTHLKLIVVSIFCIILSIFILNNLFYLDGISMTYFLYVFLISIGSIISIVSSLLTYSLHIFNSITSIDTDDAIYLVKLFHYLIGIFSTSVAFIIGIYILFFESFGILRSTVVLFDGFGAIGLVIISWNAFEIRRQAINKISSLIQLNKQSYTELIINKARVQALENYNDYSIHEKKINDILLNIDNEFAGVQNDK